MSRLNKGRNIGSQNKIKVHCGLKEFFKWYKNHNEKPVDYSIYAKVIREVNEDIAKAIIYDNFYFKMPGKLGYIHIVKKKYKNRYDEDGKLIVKWRAVDYKATYKLWEELYPDLTPEEVEAIPNKKRVYHRNQHSNGYFFRWLYDRRTSTVPNNSVYYFKPTRTNCRTLSSYVKSKDFEGNYFEQV